MASPCAVQAGGRQSPSPPGERPKLPKNLVWPTKVRTIGEMQADRGLSCRPPLSSLSLPAGMALGWPVRSLDPTPSRRLCGQRP